jgi:hypothetical protein
MFGSTLKTKYTNLEKKFSFFHLDRRLKPSKIILILVFTLLFDKKFPVDKMVTTTGTGCEPDLVWSPFFFELAKSEV